MMMLKDSNKDEILRIDQDEAKLALQQLFGSQIVLRNYIYMAHKNHSEVYNLFSSHKNSS